MVNSKEKIITMDHIRKIYSDPSGRYEVLKDINLTVNRNDIISIMGPSGSGKTTLLNIIGLLDNFDSGDYHISEIDTK